MLKFKQGDYVQDKQANIYQVIEVDSFLCVMPYLLRVVKLATDDIVKSSPSSFRAYNGFDRVGYEQWIYGTEKDLRKDYEDGDYLTADDLELADPQEVKQYKEIRYFEGEVYRDDKGNEFTVLEDCTFGESSCKVKLTKRVSENVYAGNCLYEDCHEFGYCTVSRRMRLYVDNPDEVFMDELHPVKLNNNKRVIQNTKPEDQKEAKSKLLALVKQMQAAEAAENSEPTATVDKSFKERMKQIAIKVNVQEILEKVEQAANRGEFSIKVKSASEVKEALEAYGLSVFMDIVGWSHKD